MKKKSKIIGHVIDHALFCSKIPCNQRFPPLAKRVAPVSRCQNIDPIKYLRNQHEMVRSVTIGRCNWCSLTSASPPLTKISSEERRLLASSHFNRFYKKTDCCHCLDLQMENGFLFMWCMGISTRRISR